jgi:hypothetical protein
MRFKIIKTGLISLFVLTFVGACNQPFVNPVNSNSGIEKTSALKYKTSVYGSVVFPGRNSFNTEAVISDISSNATVSLINPANNKTIATGLTDSGGNFTINPSEQFMPADQSIYFLEAGKRLGDGTTGNTLSSLRTIIKWNESGESWSSITTPDIKINLITTALSVLQDLNKTTVTPISLIGTVNNVNVFTPIPAISQQVLSDVSSLVTDVLNINGDPMKLIWLQDDIYYLKNPVDVFNSKLNFDAYLFSNDKGGRGIGSVEPNGANSKDILRLTNGDTMFEHEFALNGDHSKIVYFKLNSSNTVRGVYATNIADNTSTNLTQSLATNLSILGLNFFYDRSKATFMVSSGPNKGVYLLNMNDLAINKISDDNVISTISNDTMSWYSANLNFYSSTGDNYAPWSPNGSKYVFLGNAGKGDLFLVFADGSKTENISSGATGPNGTSQPKWSGDSNHVAYLTSDTVNVNGGGGNWPPYCDFDPFGPGCEGSPAYCMNVPPWDPFCQGGPGGGGSFQTQLSRLYVTTINGTSIGSSVQMDNVESYSITEYSFSPDSSKIAWIAQTTAMDPMNPVNPEYQVFVSDISNPNPVSMGGAYGSVSSLQWSPDSTKVGFQAFDTSNSLVDSYIADVSNGNAHSASDGMIRGEAVYFLNNSTVIFRSNTDGKVYKYVIDSNVTPTVISASGTNHVIFGNYTNEHPSQRKYIIRVFDSGAGTYSLGIVNPDGSFIPVAGSSSDQDFTEPMWVRDGSKFIFKRTNGIGSDLWAVDEDGTNFTRLNNTPDSDDKNRVFFYSRQ